MTSALEIHTHLLELRAERALASIEALALNSTYVGAAVTEIATFRAELSGPQVG
jgi:hypothetical protein